MTTTASKEQLDYRPLRPPYLPKTGDYWTFVYDCQLERDRAIRQRIKKILEVKP